MMCIVPDMSTSQTLLALLEREPAYGYTLKQRFDERFARTPVSYTHLTLPTSDLV